MVCLDDPNSSSKDFAPHGAGLFAPLRGCEKLRQERHICRKPILACNQAPEERHIYPLTICPETTSTGSSHPSPWPSPRCAGRGYSRRRVVHPAVSSVPWPSAESPRSARVWGSICKDAKGIPDAVTKNAKFAVRDERAVAGSLVGIAACRFG